LPTLHTSAPPLTGITVLDLARLYPGPLAARLLEEQGARVIRIAEPDYPDYIQRFPPFHQGRSLHDLALNEGKLTKSIPYSQAADQHQLREMVAQADFLLESFRPGQMDRWGLGVSTLLAWNPKLIVLSLSAYGASGPWSKRPAHDLNILAEAGLLSLNLDSAGKPVIPAFQWADTALAQQALQACLLGLLIRQSSGRGGWFDLCMFEAVLPYLHLQWAEASRPAPCSPAPPHTDFPPEGSGATAGLGTPSSFAALLTGLLPCYNLYPTRDGRWVALAALEGKFWQPFCRASGHEEWLEHGLAGGSTGLKLREQLSAHFLKRTLAEWVTFEQESGPFCLSPVRLLREVLSLDHVQERGCLVGYERAGLLLPSPAPLRLFQLSPHSH
jgi:crotonobetainyl-CoA:carnitine CoA-transferase CaiB-like acyl-CoA transferase